jgi:hypothetical protein
MHLDLKELKLYIIETQRKEEVLQPLLKSEQMFGKISRILTSGYRSFFCSRFQFEK